MCLWRGYGYVSAILPRRLFETTLHLGEYVWSVERRFTISKAGEVELFGQTQTMPTQVFFGYAENLRLARIGDLQGCRAGRGWPEVFQA